MKTVIYKLHSSWKWNFYHRQKCKNGKLLQMDLKVHINICCTLPHTHTHHVTHLEDSSRSPRSRLSPFTSSRVTVRLSGLRGSGSSWPSGFANSSTKLSRKLWAPSCSFIPTAILWVWSNWWQVRLSHTGHFCNLPCSCSHLKRKRKKKKFNHTQTQSTFSTFSHCRLTTVFCLNRFNPASPVFWWAHSTAGMQAKLKRVSQSCVIQRQCHYECLTRLQRLHQCSAIPCNLYMHHLKLKIQTASVSIGKALNSEQIRHICSGFDMRRINAYLSVQSSFNILFLSRTSERIN